MVAASEVEVVSTAPFGCVLRHHNRNDRRCRDHHSDRPDGGAAFEKDLNHLVRDHLHGCISDSAANDRPENRPCGGGGSHHRHKKSRVSDGHDSSSAAALSHRQARVLDRWAAKQAREIVSTFEKEAEIFSPSAAAATAPPSEIATSPLSNDNSPPASEGSARSLNRGASSLVQIWEARLKHRHPHNPNPSLTVCTARTNSTSTASDIGSSPELDSRPAHDHHDPFLDSEPDKTTTPRIDQKQQQQHSQNVDERDNEKERERERVRVSDIIRRLIDHDHEPSPQESSPSRDQPSSHLVNSPRPIRGRQAFNDMLMNMERTRRAELASLGDRHAVSKFSHRGRLQAMLKLKALQRDKICQEQSRNPSPGSKVLPPASSCSIMHLREKFNSGVDKRSAPSENAHPKSSCKEHVKDTQIISSSALQQKEDCRRQKANASEQSMTSSVQHSVSQRTEDRCEEATLRLDKTRQGTKTHPNISKLQEIVTSSVKHLVSQRAEDVSEEIKSLSDLKRQAKTKTQLTIPNSQETVTSSVQHSVSQRTKDRLEEARVTWQETSSEPSQSSVLETETITLSVQHSVSQRTKDVQEDASWKGTNVEASIPSIQEISEPSASVNDDGYESDVSEDQDFDDHQQSEANLEWIHDISRPRSYWEGRRKEWYEEMLNNSSNNEEISGLIKRKPVSSFLASGFRERMDRLMLSHYEIQRNEEELDEDTTPRTMQHIMLSYLQRNALQESSDGGEDRQEQHIEEEDEEENSASSHQFPSPLLRAWSYNDNDSDEVASTASCLPSQSSPFYQGGHHFSPSRNSSSIEMELIYDLRSHMEQLHREMSELRSTIRSCVDMQLNLQNFVKHEVYSAIEEGKRSCDKSPKKGICRVCKGNKVDSLLYRCGHMCTCFKCAQELQRRSGKCPVCQAPIDDVVQVFADS